MNEHLKKSCINSEKDINNISETDAEIIQEIIEFSKKIDQVELTDKLEKWKRDSDVNVRDSLISLNVSFDSEEGNKKSRKFIDIKDESFEVKYLERITKEDTYCYMRNQTVYNIIINRSENLKTYYSNSIIEFNDLEERDSQYNIIKDKLKPFGIMFI